MTIVKLLPPAVNPPALSHTLTELPRATSETFQLLFNLRKLIKQAPSGNNQPVLTLPGYGANDGSMMVMRHFLKQIGYQAFGLEVGRNYEAPEERIMSVDDASRFRQRMVDMIGERVQDLHKQTGRKINLVGWSMGGCYALDVSQQHSDLIEKVITLGSPFGDPRGTSTWDIMRYINKSSVPPEHMDFDGWLNKRNLTSTGIPVHVIYSPRDGIVATEVARLPDHPDIRHHEIDASHVAFAYNSATYNQIARILGE